MRFSTVYLGLAVASVGFAAADKKLPLETTSNELVEITATPLIDKDQIKQELGSDLGGGIILVRVRVRPLSDKPFKIDRDDFALLSDKDGQRSTPYSPSQIAGNSTLVVTSTGTRGTIGNRGNGPIWGGIPGLGGRGQQMPGNGGSAGNGPAMQTEAKVEEGQKTDKVNPLLAVLKEKVLPEKEITRACLGPALFSDRGQGEAQRPGALLQNQRGSSGPALPSLMPGLTPDAIPETTRVADLDTPALLIDLDIMERNLTRVADYAREHDLRVRPHTKSHKIPALGRMQFARERPGSRSRKWARRK